MTIKVGMRGNYPMNFNALKEYISNIYQLESSLYAQNTLRNEIQREINKLSNIRDQDFEAHKSFNMDYETIIGMISFGAIIGCIVAFVTTFKSEHNIVLNAIALIKIIFLKKTWLYIFYGIVVALLLSLVGYIISYLNVKSDNKEIDKINENIKIKNAYNRKNVQSQISILKNEQTKVDSFINQTKNILNEYYSQNIVFDKYRNFVAISSFHEYLSCLRCTTLEGYQGAYSIYESEMRQNLIINKLDEVIIHLKAIEQNQYMLYSAINESNSKTSSLIQEMHDISHNLRSIDESNSITAYYNKITAQNSEFLKNVKLYRLE